MLFLEFTNVNNIRRMFYFLNEFILDLWSNKKTEILEYLYLLKTAESSFSFFTTISKLCAYVCLYVDVSMGFQVSKNRFWSFKYVYKYVCSENDSVQIDLRLSSHWACIDYCRKIITDFYTKLSTGFLFIIF